MRAALKLRRLVLLLAWSERSSAHQRGRYWLHVLHQEFNRQKSDQLDRGRMSSTNYDGNRTTPWQG